MTMISIIPEEGSSKTKEIIGISYQSSLTDSGNQQDSICKQFEVYGVGVMAQMPYGQTALVSKKPNLWDEFFAAAPLPDDFMEE